MKVEFYKHSLSEDDIQRVVEVCRGLFLTTGILGGYTTFSAFSLDAAVLSERGTIGMAALYVLLSVVLSIGALFAGMAVVRAVG